MKNNNNTITTTTQLVLTKRNGSLVIELPSGNKYQFIKVLLEKDESTFKSRLDLITRNPILKLIKNIKAALKQGELKGLGMKDIQVVTALSEEEIKEVASDIESILCKLSVKGLSLRNERYYLKEEEIYKEEVREVYKFLNNNFLEDLRVLAN